MYIFRNVFKYVYTYKYLTTTNGGKKRETMNLKKSKKDYMGVKGRGRE